MKLDCCSHVTTRSLAQKISAIAPTMRAAPLQPCRPIITWMAGGSPMHADAIETRVDLFTNPNYVRNPLKTLVVRFKWPILLTNLLVFVESILGVLIPLFIGLAINDLLEQSFRGEFIFCDCSPESPAGRRSLCYDREALIHERKRRFRTGRSKL